MRRPAPRISAAGRFTGADLFRSFSRHQAVFWGSLAITLAAAIAACLVQAPLRSAEIRVAIEDAGQGSAAAMEAAGRALAGDALRLAALDSVGWWRVFPDLFPAGAAARATALARLADSQTVWLAEGGHALLVRTEHPDPAVAVDLDRALVAALLARPIAAPPIPAPPVPVKAVPMPAAAVPPALAASRARVAAELASADRRAAMLSESLTDTAHDMVAALRVTGGLAADGHPPGSEVVDQGRALLAELQLKRLQLVSRYQDDFPAVTALDGEIERLRAFVAGEQKRVAAPRAAANPVQEILAAERRRLAAELDDQNAGRAALRTQLAALDQQIAAPPRPAVVPAAAPVTAPRFAAGAPTLSSLPDPRLVSVPALLVVGVLGSLLLQWMMLRGRKIIVTPAEAELVLGVPVLRCLDAGGNAIIQERRMAPAPEPVRLA